MLPTCSLDRVEGMSRGALDGGSHDTLPVGIGEDVAGLARHLEASAVHTLHVGRQAWAHGERTVLRSARGLQVCKERDSFKKKKKLENVRRVLTI